MDGATLPLALTVLAVLIDFVIRVFAVVLVPKNRRPTTAAAWLLAIFFLPYIGALLFLLFGSAKLPRSRRNKQQEINRFILEATSGVGEAMATDTAPIWFASATTLNRRLGAMPLIAGNAAEIFGDYVRSIREMTDAVDNAESFVHAQFYILSFDATTAPFFDALEAAVRRGVTVRVMFDHIASLRIPGYRRTKRRLTKAGGGWGLALPLPPPRGPHHGARLRQPPQGLRRPR